MKKLSINSTDSLTAIWKEMSYKNNEIFFEQIQKLIDHKLIEVITRDEQIFHGINGGYEMADIVTFVPKIPERIAELEKENTHLKNQIDVFKTVFQKGEPILTKELQDVYDLAKKVNPSWIGVGDEA